MFKRDLRFEAFYAFAPELVWEALTDSDSIAEWLMPNDFQPLLGHKFVFRTKPAPGFDGIVNCEVLEIEPPSKLSYSWVGGGIYTVVTFTLAARVGGSHLVLEHKGFDGVRGLVVSRLLGQGWRSKVLKVALPQVLERLNLRRRGAE